MDIPPRALKRAVEIEQARRATLRIGPDMNPMDLNFSELMSGEIGQKLEAFVQLHAHQTAVFTVTMREVGIPTSGAAIHREWSCVDHPKIRLLAQHLTQFIEGHINVNGKRRFAGAAVAVR